MRRRHCVLWKYMFGAEGANVPPSTTGSMHTPMLLTDVHACVHACSGPLPVANTHTRAHHCQDQLSLEILLLQEMCVCRHAHMRTQTQTHTHAHTHACARVWAPRMSTQGTCGQPLHRATGPVCGSAANMCAPWSVSLWPMQGAHSAHLPPGKELTAGSVRQLSHRHHAGLQK